MASFWHGEEEQGDWREEMSNTLLKGQPKYTDKETLKEMETCYVKWQILYLQGKVVSISTALLIQNIRTYVENNTLVSIIYD